LNKQDECVTESEKRLRALIEASSEVLYRMSPDWGEMLELEGGGFLPDTTGPSRSWLMNYIPAEDRPQVTAAIDDAIRTKSVFQLEHRVVQAGGGFGWTVSRAVPVLDEAGEIVEWFGSASDVTARRTAELELRKLNATLEQRVEERSAALRLYENIVQSDTSPVVAFDTEYRLTAFNTAHSDYFLRLYGAPSRLGDVFPQQVAPGEAALLKDFMARALGGETFTVCAPFGNPDRETVRWEISYTPLRNEAGDIIGAFHHAVDVTAQAQAETTLKDAQNFARLALSAVGGVGVWTYDVATDRFFCDASIAALYALDPKRAAAGISRTEFLGNVHPDDRPPVQAVMAGGLQQAGELELEYRLVHPDGSIHWVLSRGHTYFSEQGVPVRRTGIGVDMTGQRQLEDQLRQSQKMEALGQLTGGIAHDFNNLLTVIRGSAELLRRPALAEEKRQRYAAAVADTADRASKLTSQLLSFARRQALTPETFEVAANIHAMEAMLGTLIGPRIEMHVDTAECPCPVSADRTQFDTAIVNMAVNARDAMEGEGVMRIAAKPVDGIPAVRSHAAVPGAFVAISVSDTGAGIPADKLDRIFEPFFTTKGVGQGTGLGLSQVFGFAKQSGGDVIASNGGAPGATFTLYLPVAEHQERHVPAPELPAVLTQGARVLVVEDNAKVGEFAAQALAELGFEPVLVGDADAALAALAESDHFQVVFSDVVMPGMSGIALGLEIRQRYPGLPIILTSGYSEAIVKSGTEGFPLLRKPYSIESLSRMLQTVVGM
jgi:signal transduction histidine kinase